MTTDRPRCGARKRASAAHPKPCMCPDCVCKRVAGFGTEHLGEGQCKYHGGNMPNNDKSSKATVAVKAATEALQTYGLPIPVDPVQGLLEEIARTNGHIHWLRVQITELDADALIEGVKSEKVGRERGEKTNIIERGPGIHVWLDLYHKERAHFASVIAKAVAARISERQIALAEWQGAMAATMLRAVLDGLQLTPDQSELVPALVAQHMPSALS